MENDRVGTAVHGCEPGGYGSQLAGRGGKSQLERDGVIQVFFLPDFTNWILMLHYKMNLAFIRSTLILRQVYERG